MMTKCNISSIYAKRMTATGGLTIEALAKNWMITLPQAKLTLDATTQRAIRVRPKDLVRRFKTNDRSLRYTQLMCTVFTDTFKADTESKQGNLYGQIYIAVPSGYMRVYAMKEKGDAHLHCLISSMMLEHQQRLLLMVPGNRQWANSDNWPVKLGARWYTRSNHIYTTLQSS
jgi:hypothetical protein